MARGTLRAGLKGSDSHRKTKTFLAHRGFLCFVVVLFALQAAWIAARGRYPMAFDESYHVGIIQLYAHQWSPYFAHLSAATAQFGALPTDPSYLYHYLLSFPYRGLMALTHNFTVTIIVLRLLNVALFTAGILVFRKVLRYTSASDALINLVLFFFTLLPLESFTAAQINYDNLLFPLTGLALLFALRFAEKLHALKQFDLKLFTGLAAVSLLASQVKYSFLPILAGIGLFAAYLLVQWGRSQGFARALSTLRQTFRSYRAIERTLLVVLLLVSVGSFAWRYGYNTVTYHTLLPRCETVWTVKDCQAYPVWSRSYQLAQTHVPSRSLHQMVAFSKAWVHIMYDELFTVISANQGRMESPVKQLIFSAAAVGAVGVVLVVANWRRLMRSDYQIVLFVSVTVLYIGALLMQNYADFTKYGIPVAVQGRYLLPVLLLIMLLGARAYSIALRNVPHWKSALVLASVLVFVQGGGVITYLLRADQSWYWPPRHGTQLSLEATASKSTK